MLDAARGLLTVVPAASFDGFRVELDMLDPQHRPRLNEDRIRQFLEALDIQVWDDTLVHPILCEIANSLSAESQVDKTFSRIDRAEERPRLSFAPAIVLRARRSTAYEELISKFLQAATGNELKPTCPLNRLLHEGESTSDGLSNQVVELKEKKVCPMETRGYLFPLPFNEEQRQIVDRLQADPCVLVKGPPGTGKSHTIANLICHLLARGDRVLVTAHAPKALMVLRDKLPAEIRALCVWALGSSREDQRLLEESVRGILRRRNEWRRREAAERAIETAERELRELERKLAQLECDLRAFREAETHSHELPGGYSGTAAKIARRLSEEEREFGWFPSLPADVAFPLEPSESAFLAQAHSDFTADARTELELAIGDAKLPDPNEFQALIARVTTAEESARRLSRGVDGAKLEFLESTGTEQLQRLRNAVQVLSNHALRVGRVLGDVSEIILLDLLASAEARWTSQATASEILVKDAKRLLEAIGSARVDLPHDIPEDRLKTDVERRLAHFEGGGRKGFFIFVPRVVRETNYIAECCRVDGNKVAQVVQLRCVRDHLELQRKVRELREVWGASLADVSNFRQLLSRAEELTTELKQLLEFFKSELASPLATVLGSKRTALASAEHRIDWLKAIDALLASREARVAQQELDRLIETVCGQQHGLKPHPCLRSLEGAARARDTAAWRAAWQERERLRQEKQRLVRYESLLEKLDRSCPGLAELLRRTGGEPTWRERVGKLREAWSWAAACAWLRKVSDASSYEACVQDYHRLKKKIEKATENLVSNKAWKAFFDRLDERSAQSLIAWTQAVDRIGKGTGKHAYRHRRSARRYLMDCVPSIPAWVMPLHKLWDSVEAVPGLFDTIIVDEASQAGIDTLILLLLAKRIVVVGDDKQNSPEAVGVLEDDIARLARGHLNAFRFRDEFRPDTSLFDHARRTFSSHISLREHFRCVPEIIRFSNDLCYSDAPLIPLRQAPPERLPPLCSRFVAEGACEGEGQRIRNPPEAEALVDTIVRLVDDKVYKGKTMGVIALQGHAQAQLIENLLARRLDPKLIEERRLRCGEPASFQGDERDVIFLSLVIASNARYRALTRLPDQRRFNVAMSRARDQVWLFYSIRPHDLMPDDLRCRLIRFFESAGNGVFAAHYENLERLERVARGPRRKGTQPEPYESWFEVDVALELLRRKFRVRPQVEVAGRRIDLVIEGLGARIAVECDGDEWHGPEQYEHDMARQRQLERAGWTFVRVRELDFYLDRQRTINAVVDACEKLGIRPVDFANEPQPERPKGPDPNRGSLTAILEENAIDGEDSKEGCADSEASFSIVGPFTGYSEASGFPDPREASPEEVREALRQIIERDGPLARSSVYRLYVEGSPSLQRVGKIVRQALNRALATMLQAGEILQEDELGDGSPEGQVLRIASSSSVKVRPAGRRDLLEIPPSELIAVLKHSPLATNPRAQDVELFRLLLRHYGYKSLTAPRRKYLSKVVRLFRERS